VVQRLIRGATAVRKRVGGVLTDGFFEGLSRLGRLHPNARPERHGVEVLRDLPYGDDPAHRLDVWRPIARSAPSPAVLYIHGGAFRILSKDTHWIMALAFARRGCTVFNVGYRLAPRHPFPAAVVDVCRALEWVASHGNDYGADLSRFVLAGESAGANLATSLTLALCFERQEPFARAAFATGLVPRAVVPMCGVFQVSDQDRFRRRKAHLPAVLFDRLLETETAYLPPGVRDPELELADPVRVLESDRPPQRPLPPFFLSVGTADPLLDDTRRLGRALHRRGVTVDVRYYPGELHAFQALVFRPQARVAWRETFGFLQRELDVRLPAPDATGRNGS
jgi:acetyl esterase